MVKESRLYIEQNKKTNEYQVVVVVGKFKDRTEAAHHASYIALTKSIDFSPSHLLENLSDLEDWVYGEKKPTLH